MLSSLAGMAMEAATGAMESVADAAEGLIPGKKQLDELSDRLKSAGEPVQSLKDTVTKAVPNDDVTANIAKFKEQSDGLIKTIKDATEGDGKDLVPGAAGCVAGCWISSVKAKLGKLKEEVNAIAIKAVGAPANLTEKLRGLAGIADAFMLKLESAVAIPKKAIDEIKSALTDPKKLLKIPDAIEGEFRSLLDSIRTDLQKLTQTITDVCASLLEEIQAIVDEVLRFLPREPKKLASAFKPPASICCCCCCGAGKVADTLDNLAGQMSNAAMFDNLLTATRDVKTALDGVDFGQVTDVLNEVDAQMTEAMKPVREAADKLKSSGISGVASGLRNLAAGTSDKCEAPDS